MKRLIAVAAACAVAMACGGVDQKRFDGVFTAGKALQEEVQSSGGGSPSKERDLLKQFDTEINALTGKTIGIKEADALKAYEDAMEAYRTLLRFRAMDPEADGQLLVVKGPNLEAAVRYKLPTDTRNGDKVVNRAQAVTILLQAAEQRLADGNRLSGR